MKTKFELEGFINTERISAGSIEIVGKYPKSQPYVAIEQNFTTGYVFIKDKDLERFAINILKALKSKHFQSNK